MSSLPAAVSPEPAVSRPAWRAVAVTLRLVVAGAVAVLAAVVLTSVERFQYAEAAVAAWTLAEVLGRPSRLLTTEPTYLFQKVPGDDTSWTGLVVTHECSAALFVGGTLALTAVLLAVWHRARAGRLLAAALTAVVLLCLVNTTRLVLIGESAARWGEVGFGWMHTVVGTFLMVATLALCAVLFARIGLLRSAKK